MRIRTLWERGDGEDMPWLVDAVDEYTEDANDGLPESYVAAMNTRPEHKRELVIHIPESAVRALFTLPQVEGKVGK